MNPDKVGFLGGNWRRRERALDVFDAFNKFGKLFNLQQALVVLRNVKYTNLCLHVVGSNDKSGSAIDTATCDGNDHGQLIRLDEVV